jgi:hypothetical protein
VEPGAGLLAAELHARAERSGGLERSIWQLAGGEAEASLETLHAIPPATGEAHYWDRRWVVPVLRGDWSRGAAEARAHLEQFGDRFVPGYRELLGCLLSLIAADEAAARNHLERLRSYVARHDRLRSRHPSVVAEIAEGLLAGDPARLAIGLDGLLDWHLRRTRSNSDMRNSSSGVMSMDAIVILLLAHRRGLRVPVAGKYRSARVPLLVIAMTEWHGQPLGRDVQLSLETDLVAGPWLASQGLHLEPDLQATQSRPPKGGLRRPTRRSLGAPEVPAATVAGYLRRTLDKQVWPTWQRISAAIMLGDAQRARAELFAAAEEMRSRRQRGPKLGGSDLPHPRNVLQHFGLALAMADGATMGELTPLLRAYVGHPSMHPTAQLTPFGVELGYLLFISVLLDRDGPQPTDEQARIVGAPYRIGPACYGLYLRDGAALSEHLNAALGEHCRQLERRSAPPPILCEPVIHVAVAAHRLGIPIEMEPRYFEHPAPIVLREPPDFNGEIGRLPCDLLGRALWA